MAEGCDRCTQVVHQLEAIHDLHGRRCPTAHAFGVERTPSATDDGHGRVLGEPEGHGVRRACGQEGDAMGLLQVHEAGARAWPSPPGPLGHAKNPWGRARRRRGRRHQPQQGGRTAPQAQAGRETRTRRPTEGDTAGE
jgi:hypothetical protein